MANLFVRLQIGCANVPTPQCIILIIKRKVAGGPSPSDRYMISLQSAAAVSLAAGDVIIHLTPKGSLHSINWPIGLRPRTLARQQALTPPMDALS